MKVTRQWHLAMEEGNSSAAIFFDLSKAFDSLPHSLMLSSLARIGVCGSQLVWVRDYPASHFQRVVLGGSSSSFASVTSGVPQGSILGPLLFIISMDSLTSVPLSPRASLVMYADDICYSKVVSLFDRSGGGSGRHGCSHGWHRPVAASPQP